MLDTIINIISFNSHGPESIWCKMNFREPKKHTLSFSPQKVEGPGPEPKH